MHDSFSRRRFLASALSMAGSAAVPTLAGLAASANAAAGNDYKALVCVFLTGGNDAHNTVLATDAKSWHAYQRYRGGGGATSIALGAPGTAQGVLPLWPTTRQPSRRFALHPQLGELIDLFDAMRAAVVPNVGPLVLQDSETGEQLTVDTHDPRFRARFHSLAAERRQRLTRTFAAHGVDLLSLSTDQAMLTELADFARRRRQAGNRKPAATTSTTPPAEAISVRGS